jgi:hypothetical protein
MMHNKRLSNFRESTIKVGDLQNHSDIRERYCYRALLVNIPFGTNTPIPVESHAEDTSGPIGALCGAPGKTGYTFRSAPVLQKVATLLPGLLWQISSAGHIIEKRFSVSGETPRKEANRSSDQASGPRCVALLGCPAGIESPADGFSCRVLVQDR